jgi:hypothetical protein
MLRKLGEFLGKGNCYEQYGYEQNLRFWILKDVDQNVH